MKRIYHDIDAFMNFIMENAEKLDKLPADTILNFSHPTGEPQENDVGVGKEYHSKDKLEDYDWLPHPFAFHNGHWIKLTKVT